MLAMLSAMLLMKHDTLWLSHLFSDNMVLQRERPIPVFGAAAPGASITIQLGDSNVVSTKADKDGKFLAKLKPMQAGGPYTLTVTDGKATRTIPNVLIGEVWVASGQSNMQFTADASTTFEAAKASTNPNVRMFTVPDISLEEPADDVNGKWEPASATTVGHFSAVGYYFAKELYDRLHVPIGIIHTSWGGTPAESWTSRETLLKNPRLRYIADRYLANIKDIDGALKKYQEALGPWRKKAYPQESDNKGERDGWAGAGFDDSSWGVATLPGAWETNQNLTFDGALWYRKSIDVPASMAGKDLTLSLGPIDDTDTTYFNGEKVGGLPFDTPNVWQTPRVYTVPGRLVKAGANTVAVRVFDSGGAGGLCGEPSDLKLSDAAESIDLSGAWRWKIEQELIPPSAELASQAPTAPLGPGDGWVPGGLYNGMIAPLIPYSIKGAIWYQGEANADRAYQYRELFPLMIEDWRNHWGQGSFPFYFVQLANYMARNTEPVQSSWAELREAQTMTLKHPNTGMAVIIDIGEAMDIHPRNKLDVGRRLAYWALAKNYGKKMEYSSPLYKSMKREGSAIRIAFDHASGLKTSDGRAVVGFAIAGADRKFVWADARIEGETIVVSSPKVVAPVAVRYGWSDNPDVNLVNSANLPASPFRTDEWPGVTYNAR